MGDKFKYEGNRVVAMPGLDLVEHRDGMRRGEDHASCERIRRLESRPHPAHIQ